MKTEEQIKEQINIYAQIKAKSNVFTSEFTLANGAITALNWVLEKGEELCQ